MSALARLAFAVVVIYIMAVAVAATIATAMGDVLARLP